MLKSDGVENFETLVVIEFSCKLPPPSVDWILKKITDPRAKGGAELLACTIVDQNLGVKNVLLPVVLLLALRTCVIYMCCIWVDLDLQ